MKPIIPILAAVFALIGASAPAQSIDCAKTSTKLEQAICADPVMRDYDARIAAAYARARTMWNGAIATYVEGDQQQWLTGFQAIERLDAANETDCVLSDVACVRETMRRRVEEIESNAYPHSGVYRSAGGMKLLLQPGLADGYSVRIYDPAKLPGVNVITLDAGRAGLWDGPQAMVSTMGDANGLPLAKDDGCTLRLTPEALVIEVVQTGICQGHSLAGRYKRLLDENLRSYELELY
ncbi:MAG: hypothetical protein V4618_13140 [Pseudomonadota bacterium]